MNNSKVVIVGTGMVGMSYAYSIVNQGVCEELVLIDVDKNRAKGEAIDLNHGLNFAPRKMNIYAGDYSDCKDADLICITAGASIQKEGETRLDLLHKNTQIMRSIVNEIKKSGFNGVILIATNPVDIMTYVCWKLSGYDKSKIIGSGTTLDTARLRYTLSEKLNTNINHVNTYVIGEHGDSQLVPWSHAFCDVQPINEIASKENTDITFDDLHKIEDEVRNIAYKIIEYKKSTYYGIGMALTKITKAILQNENSVLTVSTYLNGEYGHEDVYVAVPSIINKDGVREIINLSLSSDEKEKLDKSIEIIKENINKLDL